MSNQELRSRIKTELATPKNNYSHRKLYKKYQVIIDKFCENIESLSYQQKLYHYSHNIIKIPICQMCDNDVKFISYKEGYRIFCCTSCCVLGTLEKRDATCMEKYGTKHPMQNKDIRKKASDTYKKRTGYGYPMQNPVVKEKTMITCNELYDGNAPACYEVVKNKMKKTTLKNHEVENVFQKRNKCFMD